MKITEKWLREWVDPDISIDQLATQLTMLGLEVDSIATIQPAFSGVVIAKIESIERHPDAEKLRVCRVNSGSASCQIVCGAANIYEGMYAPLALPGATLGDIEQPIKIKSAKLRGIKSEGMLCAASELGFEDSVDGLWDLTAKAIDDSQLGIALQDYLALTNRVIDVDLTPNRGDCLSVRGIAREVSVANLVNMRMPFEQVVIEPSIAELPTISIADEQACSRYIGRFINNIDVGAKTPDWMREKLENSGIRCHEAIVDITNYVLLELGQPLHAFDADKFGSNIVVRMSQPGEKLTTLDAKQLALHADTLVITDGAKAVALAGIMGGLDSAIAADTKNILLESAFFDPLAIAGRARQYGLHTDASHRFERGVDPDITELAIERATELVLAIAGGQAGALNDVITERHARRCDLPEIVLQEAFITRQLDITVERQLLEKWFELSGFSYQYSNQCWYLKPPSWRFDIAIAEDIIEEIARWYGYDKLPIAPLPAISNNNKATIDIEALSRRAMVDQGFNEIISYSFIAPELAALFNTENQASILIDNPLAADMSSMRQSLLPGLISTAKYNINRQMADLQLFEIGQCFDSVGGAYNYTTRIAGLICGVNSEQQWYAKPRAVDFFDIKGVLENWLNAVCDGDFMFKQETADAVFHPGQCALVINNNNGNSPTIIGRVGAINPRLLNQLDIDQAVFAFELDLQQKIASSIPQFKPISPFPSTRRDIAFEIADDIDIGSIMAVLNERRPKILKDIVVFDVYRGEGITECKKSIALGLIIASDEKTLKDEEVQRVTYSIIERLKRQFDIVIR